MTKEEKDLLLKDLCARFPYGVMVHLEKFVMPQKIHWSYVVESGDWKIPKPYLRPMSSMTEEERFIYEQRLHDVGRSIDVIDADDVVSHIDWLLERHFDFRGLIPMGLALKAPEGMYNTKTE